MTLQEAIYVERKISRAIEANRESVIKDFAVSIVKELYLNGLDQCYKISCLIEKVANEKINARGN